MNSRCECARRQSGFTLVEMMVASALSLVLATAIGTLAWFSTRSFVAMAAYTEMNQRSQFALDKMSKEIRQVRGLTAYSTNNLGTINSLTFAKADGSSLRFTHIPASRKLVRVSGVATNALLTDCDSLQFQIFQHTMISNTFDCYTNFTSLTNARVIQVNWKNSRNILGKKATTESVQSAKIAIRNR